MTELETAEQFERLLREGNESPLPRIMRIEKRDAAVALAVLDEMFTRTKATMSPATAAVIDSLRTKYQPKEPSL